MQQDNRTHIGQFGQLRRRTMLGLSLGATSAVLAACVGQSRYLRPDHDDRTGHGHGHAIAHEVLRPWQRNVLYWVAETMIPAADGWPTVDAMHLVEQIEEKLSHLPARDRADFVALLTLLEYGAPLLGGGLSTFTAMHPQARTTYLAAWETSTLPLKRTGFAGLKYFVMMHYYDDPRAWPGIDYPGPPKLERA